MSYRDDPKYKEWLQLSDEERKKRLEANVVYGDVRAHEKGGFSSGLKGKFSEDEAVPVETV